jgi:hypothetical protein
MSATMKFYTGLTLVLAIIITVSYYAGYKSGFHAGAATVRTAGHATVPRSTP